MTQQDTSSVVPVILCGASGARPFASEGGVAADHADMDRLSCFQRSALLARQVTPSYPVVVCNVADREVAKEQLVEVGLQASAVVCEPSSRGTAAAVAAAAAVVAASAPGALLLVLPPDRTVRSAAPLLDAVQASVPAAREGYLVMFGAPSGRTRHGEEYVRLGHALGHLPYLHVVDAFAGGRDLDRAGSATADEGWLCNSKFLLLSCRAVLVEIDAVEPRLARAAAIATGVALLDRVGSDVLLDERSFDACPRLSVEAALMERTARAVVLRTALEWTDPRCATDAPRVPAQTRGDPNRVAVDGPAAVDTAAALIARIPVAPVVERPWGTFESLGTGTRHQVKHLIVHPGQKLSLQRHRHRSEHWVVVEGTARVVCGERTCLLRENEYLHVPLGAVHRIENPSTMRPLHVVEVQVGDYLGEDDIERLDDDYGRA